MAEEEKQMDINELIDKPYSELTEDEIEFVIEFKAAIKARDAEHTARMALIRENLAQMAAANMEVAVKAQTTLEALTAHAMRRLESEENGQA